MQATSDNPALAALRRACSKGEPILERPTRSKRGGEEPETAVVFRRWPTKRDGSGGDVLALFPMLPETRPGTCASYAHVGQHGTADYSACIRATKPAELEAEDVQALRRELERIGYRLRVLKRSPGWKTLTAARCAAGL